MLKMETKEKVTTVRKDGKIKFIGTYREALEYVFYQRFIALVGGKNTTSKVKSLYPVLSLKPPLKKKVVYILDEEAV